MRMLHGILLLLGLAASCEALAGEGPAFGPSPAPPAFEVCRATVGVSGSRRPMIGSGPLKAIIYLSDIMPRGPVNDEDIRMAYENFVREKYGHPTVGSECRYAYTREEAQKIRDVDFRAGVEGQTFVETGWMYKAPAGAAAPATPHFAACWAHNDPQVKYYSTVFDGSRDDARQWVPAFQGYLRQQYGFDGPAQCIADRSEGDARKYLDTLIEQDRQIRTVQGAPPKIVETAWKY